ncbi:hypothetical protein [Cognaticolwellia mytili]|uniref:hypothetical protein n=1 Tax=Cognaticolwellia mytili TaxID=1888913 RepID=UPI000A16EB55|nr:hypothetical protein [Cognaticolwellia mytili]
MKTKKLFLSSLILITACNSSTSSTSSPPTSPPQVSYDFSNSTNLSIPINSDKQKYKVLLFGNSHISGLEQIIEKLITIGLPEKSIELTSASSQLYLKERLYDGSSLNTLQNTDWTHVIFQAQKYSQSGTVDYPIDGTKKWLQLTKEQNATPILFPEHPQQGNAVEGIMVHNIHTRIAEQESSCVAPIGLTWNEALMLKPTLQLHNADGNHASMVGRFLSSLVFYEVITGSSADLLPYIESIDLDVESQDFLGQIASQIIAENPACQY